MSEFVIELDHIWKGYPLQRERPGFKECFVNFHRFIERKRERGNHFYALKGVTLRIQKGECVGIVGRNGAGKSTLLSIILGTTLPTKGSVNVQDWITPLLELGGGFHPELTGRENVILNGVLLGLTKEEVCDRMSSIVGFSELEEFIDLPVRTYSSGMYVRLAFAVAIYADPRILAIDEILSVGDEGFQRKSKEALLKMIRSGVTTVFVSHNLQAVEEICNRVLWLDHGEVISEGKPDVVIENYRKGTIPAAQ
jgi:ABC-type polysaccharide/polyol phosphate transport system ATPase subunit